MTGQFLPVPGGQLWVEQAGAGSTVVLVHGGLGDRQVWDGQFAALAGRLPRGPL